MKPKNIIINDDNNFIQENLNLKNFQSNEMDPHPIEYYIHKIT